MDKLKSVMRIFDQPKILIVIFVSFIIAIPSLTYLIKQRTSFQSSASSPYNRTITQDANTTLEEVPKTLPLDELLGLDKQSESSSSGESSESAGLNAQVNFGPILNFKIQIQGRSKDNQGASVFVGIAAGSVSSQPQYLLSFTVKVPNTGYFEGLSLAGLNVGNQYTAYIKGPAQIATASAFVVKPNKTELNSGLPLKLISGDLNEDNVINDTDYKIAIAYFGLKTGDQGWNENIDINADGIINSWDLAIILSNINRTGAGDEYKSTVSSGSANLKTIPLTPKLAPNEERSEGGYWMWVP